jgi:hypothetical protein
VAVFLKRLGPALAVLIFWTQTVSLAAVPPSETLLPSSTKGFLSVGSVDQLRAAWDKTQLGQLTQDPAMKPFMDDLRRQIQNNWTKTHHKLGITWDDLDGVPSGEVGVGMILLSPTDEALAIVSDIAGNQAKATAMLDKIQQNLAAQKAVRSQRNVHGTSVTVFDIPKRGDEPARQMIYFIKGDLLGASDNVKVIEGILGRLGQTRSDSLASVPAFQAIMKRCGAAAGELAPHVRWFVEPFGYADAMRLSSGQPRRKGTDMLKILREQGFTAIEGIGGFVNFSVAPYEVLHRTYAHAPGNKGAAERFTLAARMLEFPNGGNFTPPDWVPRDIATYIAGNLNSKNAFESSKTLVNEIVGDEVFEDVLESIRTDENGPRIDIRRDIIAHLGNRVTLISDIQLPVTPKSERMLVAVDTTDEKRLAEVIKSWMETDPDTRRREVNGHVVWEIVDEKSELPMVTIENSPLDADAGKPEEPAENDKPLLPNSAVTVAHGHLFVATHVDILAKVLTEVGNGQKLSESPDYLRVEAELGKLAMKEQCGQAFTRTDDAYRGVYELLRTGKMPESESMFGKLLNSMLGEGKEGVLREQRIDGSKLPDYDMVRRYLGPAGATMTTEEEGWFLTGFTLNKEAE